MARTFSTELDTREKLVQSWFDNDRQGVHIVRVDPDERRNEDGSTSVSMGFPVLAITGFTSSGDKMAALVAELLTKHFAEAEGR